MRKRFLLAATTVAAVVPALVFAQARPATPPAQQPRPANPPPAAQPRPAATRPAMGTDRSGSIELTGSLGAMVMDAGVSSAKIAPAGFARFGYNLNNRLGLSAGLGFGSVAGGSVMQPFVAATFTPNMSNKMSPFVTVGLGVTKTTAGTSGADHIIEVTSQFGAHAGAGIRSFIGDNLALRLEGRIQYDKYASGERISSAINSAASLGVSYFMGGGPPRDTDMDGVPDRRDACANTARGATVDARGCPQDTDRDGVFNGLDRCPDTPANTPVDANGCTRDSDRDGIADNLDRCPNTAAGTPVDANGCARDTDGDGVADNADRCANTVRGTPVDANGCPRDSDGDGVLDPADRCPSTPAGTPVDANGCPRDSDSDGVADNLDRCPNTAAGTQVDANGCPVARDADRDGVIDANDRCPNTAAGARVDANGCPLWELPATGSAKVVAVTFTGTATRPVLSAASRAELDKVATAIQATPNSRWEIGGYTDNRGVPATLTRVSQARATAVMTYLVSKGIAASQLTAVGYGSRNPVQPNTTVAGRTANRRVEIKRIQ